MSDIIKEIKERRVLPAVGVYAAGSWLVVEVLDRLVDRYLLSPYITDMVFWGLFSLIPAVLLVAWSYGRPGRDKATTAQKVGVPINIIATIGLLISGFSDKDLGMAASLVTVANEEGRAETHYVPSESHRRRLAVFFFENTSDDPALDWLQYGMTNLLVQDLQQDPFIAAIDPWENWGNGFYLRMRRAGFERAVGLPHSLQRDIAEQANRQHFVDGEIDQADGEYRVTARVWNTRSLAVIEAVEARGPDLYAVAERVSMRVRNALDIPEASRITQSMPLSETFGESQEAFRLHIEALNTRLFDNDVKAADALYDRAVAADPGFVLSWYMKSLNLFEAGDLPGAQAAMHQARSLDYRLPERDRTLLKLIGYRLAGESEKVFALLRLQVELHGDASSYNRLATMLMFTGRRDEAKAAFRKSLAIDPMNMAIHLKLSQLERSGGNMQKAIEHAQAYQEQKPEDKVAYLVLGDLLRDHGLLDQAAEQYLQAQLLADSPVTPLIRLSDLAARNGDMVQARQLLEQADETAETPMDLTLIRQSAAQLEYRLGRVRAAIEQINAQHQHAVHVLPPIGVAIAIHDPLVRSWLDLGDVRRAEEALRRGQEMLQPPMDQFLSFSEALVHMRTGDLQAAERSLEQGEAIVAQFEFEPLHFLVEAMRAALHAQRGEYEQAVERQAASIDALRHSPMGAEYFVFMPAFLAHLATWQVRSGRLDAAEQAIREGMQLDSNEPLLWLAKARFLAASGVHSLATASLAYALAIWAEADPEYIHLQRAREFEKEIAVAAR